MPDSSLRFAKIVATPTLYSWGQAYNAGGLFAVLSLYQDDNGTESLNLLGKDLISNLEAEFFTLEEKNLLSIKQALTTLVGKIPPGVIMNFVLGYNSQNLLYLFLVGAGKAVIRRDAKTGILLGDDQPGQAIATASGILQDGDLLILQTKQFGDIVPPEMLFASTGEQSPSDIAEDLSPKIHGGAEGGAAAIILSYHKLETDATKEENDEEEEKSQFIAPPVVHSTSVDNHDLRQSEEQIAPAKIPPFLPLVRVFLSRILRPASGLTHSRKVLLSVAVLLLFVLVGSIYVTKINQEQAQNKALFKEVFTKAETQYEEGTGLLTLNASLARDNFLAAKKILLEGKGGFKEGSEEEEKISELLAKVEEQLGDSSQAENSSAKEVDTASSASLSALVSEENGLFAAQDEKGTYVITDDAILSGGKALIENDNDWETVGGFGAYSGNFYVLDTKDGIHKFVAGEDGYGKIAYFKDVNPDLSKAVGMGIDGSIWVLLRDGTITKFTKGVQDSFRVSGLDTQLVKPTSLFTDKDSDFLYILDSGNGRIVKIGKDGTYTSSLKASILKSARAFDVVEKEKKIYILSGKKVWQIEMK